MKKVYLIKLTSKEHNSVMYYRNITDTINYTDIKLNSTYFEDKVSAKEIVKFIKKHSEEAYYFKIELEEDYIIQKEDNYYGK